MTGARTPVLGHRRLALLVTLVAAAFVLFFPARQLVQQREQVVALERRMAALRDENQRLEQEVARLSDPEELEALARERLGLVRPGERAYFMEPTSPPPTARPAAPTERAGVWGRVWQWLHSLVRGRG